MSDPIQQMELEEKRRAVKADKRLQEAKEKFGEEVDKRLPQAVEGGESLELVFCPDDRLSQVCTHVDRTDSDVRELLKNMAYTMYLCGGIGLSGPQVGHAKRIFVADWSGGQGKLVTVINPEILSTSSEKQTLVEGCLSFPAVRFPVERPAEIRAHWWSERGQETDVNLEGWAARIFQHELDHLDGSTYLDRVSAFTRQQALKKLSKLQRRVGKDMRKDQKRRQRRNWR